MYDANRMGSQAHLVINLTQDALNILSGSNLVGLLSSALTECKIICWKQLEETVEKVKTHWDDVSNVQRKTLQRIALFIAPKSLMSFDFKRM